MKTIDTHAHIYPDKIADKAVSSIGAFYDIEMTGGSGTSCGLIESGSRIGVEKYIVHSTATTVKQVKSINDFIVSECLKHPEFIGFMTLHPDMTEEEVEEEIERAASLGLKGIKLHPDFQKFYIDEDRPQKIYRAAAGRLPILFHTGDERYDFSAPERMAKVAREHKNLICIAAHFGGYTRWGEVDAYKGLDNMFFDTSSSLFKLSNKTAKEIIFKLGAEKFMFGSDYPMWSHEKELEKLLNLRLGCETEDKILYLNAKAFIEKLT